MSEPPFKILSQGEIGELAVGGFQLASGYINRIEQTNAVFIDSPYGRVYRTGDKARLLPSGKLECLGRLSDGQVKLRGQRLELGEVEQAVLRTPGCHSAVAAVVKSILVVFCAVDTGILEEDILQKCKEWLPQYMAPGEVVLMDGFPRLPSGKVDKKRLKAEYEDRKADGPEENEDLEPVDELEARVLHIVSDVLGENVRRSSSLVSAGLDSLKAIKLASALRSSNIQINSTSILAMKSIPDLVFAARNPTGSADNQDTQEEQGLSIDLETVLADDTSLRQLSETIEDVLPCTPLQSAMLAETAQNSTAYYNDIWLAIPENYTANQILDAMHELARLNEILRAGFTTVNGKFVMLLFKGLRDAQARIVDDFSLDIASETVSNHLNPLRVQIRRGSSIDGSRALVRIHHSIYDGWSMDILLSDLSKILSGQTVTQRPSFRKVVSLYRNLDNQLSDDAAQIFWSEHLLDWNKIPLPKLQDRADMPLTTTSCQRRLAISRRDVNQELQKLGCGPQVLFQATLAILWSGITGISDISIGSVTSGRTVPVVGIEDIVGPCITSLPLRIDLGTMSTNFDLLNYIQSSNRKIMEHCTVSLANIKKLCGLQPGESLYDVLFVYQESLHSSGRAKNLAKETRHVDRLETPLLFEVEPSTDGFVLQVTYHSTFAPSTGIEHLMQQFETLSLRILENLSNKVKWTQNSVKDSLDLSIDNLAPVEPEETDLAKAFEEVARKQPDLDAICFVNSLESLENASRMSFKELNSAANKVAWHLRSCGVKEGQVMAIVMEKSVNLYVSILGIIKSGCGYLPLLPSTPIGRMQSIFAQAEIQYCLVDDASPGLSSSWPNVRFINVDSAPLNDHPDTNLDIEVDLHRLAYVIYTSGTTGTPKGVAVDQRNIVANVSYLASIYPKSRGGRNSLLQACSQAFDVSVFEIFYTWWAGMCLCSGTNDTIFEDLERSIRELQVTHLSMTPTVASLVDPQNVPNVGFLVTAGEPLTQAVLDKWQDRLWQGYGPSETTNICTVKQMSPADHIEHLGHVFPNTSVVVLFPDSLDAVPYNWVGEFCFGGAQVAQGYLNMPQLTSEKFIEHSVYGRLYRSGDMGRMLSDGSLVILGRIDDQIKLRGQRIEVREINSTITAMDLASSATTLLVRKNESTSEQLASFYVPQGQYSRFHALEVDMETQQSLFAHLQSRLPAYMVPSYLVPISAIPLIPSGKVDRRQLVTHFSKLGQAYLETVTRPVGNVLRDGEWSTTEIAVADAVATSMKVSRTDFGRWTHLTILGVDSISAINLANALGSVLKVRVAVSDILRNPTVAQLARHLTKQGESSIKTKTTRLADLFPMEFIQKIKGEFAERGNSVKTVLPCTPLQEAMLSRGQKGYYNKVLMRLNTEPRAMKSYWDVMSDRHEILRTCFATTPDSQHAIAQVVLQGWQIPWMTLDVSTPSFDGAIQEHLGTLPDPVDSKVPPVSLAVLRYRGSAFLSFICHHALYDGVAMERLLKEVEALATNKPLPPPVSYSDFLEVSTQLPEDAEQFWRDKFRNYRPLSLFAHMATNDMDQSTHTTSLDIPLNELQTRLRGLGVTLLSSCQASWTQVLALAYGRLDICFGNVVSGRTLDVEGLDRLVAPCFNTIPVRVDVPANQSNIGLVKYLQKSNAELLPYQFTPLRLIQRTANRAGKHLFDTLLLLQKPLQDIDKNVWTLEGDSGDMDIPLVCEVVPCPSLNSLVINIHRDMSLVSEETATVIAELFKLALKNALTSPRATTLVDRHSLPRTLRSGLDVLEPKQEKVESTAAKTDNIKEKWSDIELQVRQVFAVLSGVPEDRIHRRTTIFQLGLDSINAVQIASVLRQKGFVISASDVIECPDCSKIAAKMLDNAASNDLESRQVYDLDQFSRQVSQEVAKHSPKGMDMEAILPCTPVQSAMLALFLQSGGDHYLNAVSYEVNPGFTAEDLSRAWMSLQSRHPMLRTGFVPISHGDSPFAMVRYSSDSSSLPLKIQHVVGGKDSDILSYKREFAAHVQASLCLPPWSVTLVESQTRVYMYLIIHHALYDAPSLDMMLGDLSTLLRGQQPQGIVRVEPAVSAILARSLGSLEPERNFWEAKASQAVVNKLPIMTPLRVEQRQMIVEEHTSGLPFSKLQQATQASNVSIQAATQAAWARVLSSYLGESSVVFGTVLSGRTTDKTKDAVFPCLNTVPIVATNVTSNAELVGYMMDYNQRLHKHQFAPLPQVQKWLGHPSGAIFDTVVAYQRMDVTTSAPMPWKRLADAAMVEYAVSLEVEPVQNDELRLCLTCYDDILPMEQAQLLLKQFDATLTHITCDVTAFQSDQWTASPDLYSIIPAVSPILPAPVQLLHQFVEAGAMSHPNKTAVEFVSGFRGQVPVKQLWNYRELDLLGNKVANLIHAVASSGSIIAVHFDKCPEAYFSILGILKAGCSFVALDPTAPKARKEFITQDSKASCLLTNDPKSLDFEPGTSVVQINVASLEANGNDQLDFEPSAVPSDTCYCLYTSGTTGTPKGCEITHDNAVQAMMAFQELFRGHWDQDSRWLQFAALHFDVSVLEQYWTWSVGITVVAAPKDLILDDLTATINKLAITHIDLTPSLARLIHPDEVPSLCRGVFITGGEQLKQEILDVWGPKAVIYNAYGPTEATIGVTMYQRVPVNGRPSNIGKQFPNVGSYIFQQGTDIPVLRGGVGELCVSGKLVGKGYLNRPELTDERFPFISEFGERVYRTGDLVRVLHDGCFDFLGRADDQVKLRGQRLEIAEINHAIRIGVTDIQDVATIVTSHGTSGKDVLVSFVAASGSTKEQLRILPDQDGLGAKVKEACRTRLPGYMVPTYILSLPFIPLSSNNKAEVKDLKRLFSELSPEQLMKLSNAATGPVSQAAQKTIRALIEAISKFSTVDKRDLSSKTSLFDVGMDSITALRLSALLKTQGFKAASPAVLLQNPIIGDLANYLTSAVIGQSERRVREVQQSIYAHEHKYRGTACRILCLSATDIDYIAPCSPLQQGIISRSIASEQRGTYFNAFELKLEDKVVTGVLHRAWDDLWQSEAILRTAFIPTTDGYVQVALKSQEAPWHQHFLDDDQDVSAFLDQEKQSWIGRNATTPSEPLRLTHVTTPQSQTLVIHIFHALYDGNSFDLMLEKLWAIYSGKDVPCGPSFLEALCHGPLLNHDICKPFWVNHLQGWSAVSLPQLGSKKPGVAVTATRTLSARPLETARSTHNVTLQALVMAAWSSVLQKLTKSRPSIGVIISGRAIGLPGVENTIGPLFNTVPFYPRITAKDNWEALVRRCHDFNTALLDFQHVPLKDIHKWCSGGKPLFDNLFTCQIELPDQDLAASWQISDTLTSPDYPLALEALFTRAGDLKLTVVAQGHIATFDQLEDLLDTTEKYIKLLESSPKGQIPVTASSESHGSDEQSTGVPSIPTTLNDSFEWTTSASAIRQAIAAVASLTTSEVSATATILELGLDSIDVIKISARLKKTNINMSPSQIMRCQTISNMTEILQNEVPSEQGADTGDDPLHDTKDKLWRYMEHTGCVMNNIEVILPPTHLQESMIAGMLQSNFESYFNHDVLRVSESVDSTKLVGAWQEVVRRTPILRTSFYECDNESLDMTYCQVITRFDSFDIPQVDLGGTEGFGRITSQAAEKARNDRGQGNLFQLTLATYGDTRYLVLSMAHALYDGWSLGLLYQQLRAAYEGRELQQPSAEPFLTRMSQAQGPQAKEFWMQYLQDASPSILAPTEASRINANGPRRSEHASAHSLVDILSFCKSQSISLQSLCQACWAVVVAQKTQSLDVTFGVVMSGRDFDGADSLVFPTMNTVALRCILHGSSSEFLPYLEENMQDIRQFQGFPLRKAQLAANLQGEGLFNTLFILQKSPADDDVQPLLMSTESASATEYPVCVEAEATSHNLIWRLACRPGFPIGDKPEELFSILDTIMNFFMTSTATHVISFQESGVSICGLPPIVTKDTPISDVGLSTDSVQDEEWDAVSAEIRDILHRVSSVPIDAITQSSTLYHLGLDSISAIKISTLLRKQGINLRPQDLIKATGISEMTQVANKSQTNDMLNSRSITSWTLPESLEVTKLLSNFGISSDQVEILPALPMQVYMLSAWQNAQGFVFWPEFPLTLQGPCTAEEIQAAWDNLVTEMPLLRTAFVATTSTEIPFLQLILKNHKIPFDTKSLADPSTSTPQPLVVASLDGVSYNEKHTWMLRLKIHHALYDGVSLPALLDRLSQLLDGAAVNPDQGFEQWRSFTINSTLDIARNKKKEFWTEYLGGVSTTVPTNKTKFDVKAWTSFLQHSAIPDMTKLRELASQSGVSLQSLFLAAYAQSLGFEASPSAHSCIVFGIYLANRANHFDLPQTYPTLNLIPIKVEAGAGRTIIAIAKEIQEDLHLIASNDRADVGLWEIYKWTGVQVSSFVNFLTLPNEEGTTKQRVQVMTESELLDSKSGAHVCIDLPWLQGNVVRRDIPVSA